MHQACSTYHEAAALIWTLGQYSRRAWEALSDLASYHQARKNPLLMNNIHAYPERNVAINSHLQLVKECEACWKQGQKSKDSFKRWNVVIFKMDG